MTITVAQLQRALSKAYFLPFGHNPDFNGTTNRFSSGWIYSTLVTTQGVAPTTAAIPTDATTGAMGPLPVPTTGKTLHVGAVHCGFTSNDVGSVAMHDRLGHMGGLNGTTVGDQTVNLDISVATSNLANRRGASDYSDVQWWVEMYTNGVGATPQVLTVTYTSGAGTPGQTTTVTIGGTGFRTQSRMIQIIPANGDTISIVEKVALAGSTGTAGNFGITATRFICYLTQQQSAIGNYLFTRTMMHWSSTGLERIHDSACLMQVHQPSNNSSSSTGIKGVLHLIEL
jgi:hypothetical protein